MAATTSPLLHTLGIIMVTTRVLAAPPPAAPSPRALVFARNPIRTPLPSEQPLPLPPTGGRLAHPWLEAMSCVIPEARPPFTEDARFPPERACSLQATARSDSRGDFTARPRQAPDEAAPEAFAEASLFFHAATTLHYFRTLGWKRPWPAGKPPLRLVANVRMPSRDGKSLVPWGDALYVPAREADAHDTIWFGQGPSVNIAHDGDTIAHEVIHALLEPFLPRSPWRLDAFGADGSPGAIDEGLADYFAAAISGDPFIGEHAVRDAESWRSRNIHTLARCPEALVGQRHVDSLLLSSALWALREPSPPSQQAALDRAVLVTLQSFHPASALSFERFLEALVTTLSREHPELVGPARETFSHRGLLPACPRVLALEPEKSLSGSSGAFVAPGGRTLGVQGLAPGLLQFHVRVPPGTTALSLRFRSGAPRPPPDLEVTPFHPVVLARRHQPLQWHPDSSRNHASADITLDLPSGTSKSARIETEGASDVFLQVANAGELDGWYDHLSLAFESAAPAPGATPEPAPRLPAACWGGMGGAGAWLGAWLWRRRQRSPSA
ncbi:hypothetical protein BHS06_28900 [Myxococcus xanthus]|uniref:hypothetical protein n=1 Tax=Myxococcus xanthus TaxID=34 RepID=UPI00112DA093|nr:hypothetical protein [Myxococcus xanthus]QDE92676.1 hypothetical protein BHS06_28900 [Myxococcus xanthus]